MWQDATCHVRRVLLVTFPNTDPAADGQVVVAPFHTSNVDIAPAFRFTNGALSGQYLIIHKRGLLAWLTCHSNFFWSGSPKKDWKMTG
jgi:hypothetical protein